MIEPWMYFVAALAGVLFACLYMAAVGPDPSDVPPSSFDL